MFVNDGLAPMRDGDDAFEPNALEVLLPGFIPAATAAELAAATARNKFPVLGRFDLDVPLLGSAGRSRSPRRRKGLGRFSSSERSYSAGRTGIEGLFNNAAASSPSDFTLVDLDTRTREAELSPVGSEAEAGRVLALRTDGFCAELRMDGFRSRVGGADDSPVDPEELLESSDIGLSRTVGEGGRASSESLSSSSGSDSKSNIFAKSSPTLGEFTKRLASSAGVGVASG